MISEKLWTISADQRRGWRPLVSDAGLCYDDRTKRWGASAKLEGCGADRIRLTSAVIYQGERLYKDCRLDSHSRFRKCVRGADCADFYNLQIEMG